MHAWFQAVMKKRLAEPRCTPHPFDASSGNVSQGSVLYLIGALEPLQPTVILSRRSKAGIAVCATIDLHIPTGPTAKMQQVVCASSHFHAAFSCFVFVYIWCPSSAVIISHVGNPPSFPQTSPSPPVYPAKPPTSPSPSLLLPPEPLTSECSELDRDAGVWRRHRLMNMGVPLLTRTPTSKMTCLLRDVYLPFFWLVRHREGCPRGTVWVDARGANDRGRADGLASRIIWGTQLRMTVAGRTGSQAELQKGVQLQINVSGRTGSQAASGELNSK